MRLPPVLGLRPFTPRQAESAGLTRSSLHRAVRRGEVRPVLHGVLVDAQVPDTVATRAAAARLVLPRRCVVSHESAAWLRGVDVLPPGVRAEVSPLRVVVGPDEAVPRRRGVRAGQALLSPEDVETVAGLAVCAPVRAGLDLACERDLVEAVVALDGLAHAGRCSVADLEQRLADMRGRRGVRGAREALALVDPLAESPMETRLRLCLVLAGLPHPVAQFVVRDDAGRFAARVDLAYPRLRLALEFDGTEAHTSPAAFRHDRERQNALLALGWTVLRFTAPDVLRAPQRTVASVRGALARLS